MSTKLSVGTHILTVLALYEGQSLTSEEIGCSVKTNAVVIRRFLGLFRKAGYVESKKGVGGGWILTSDPDQITLLDVLRTVEPENELFGLHRCKPNQECPVGRNIQGVLIEIYAESQQAMACQLARSTIGGITQRLKDRGLADVPKLPWGAH
ncbi:Rrf2 family transcriptional regulator [Singulisphaera rosea]